MSLIFAQLQMAESERNEQQSRENQLGSHLDSQHEAIAVSVSDFSALEDRIIRAVEVVKRERQERLSAEERASQVEAELNRQIPRIQMLEREVQFFKSESSRGHQRIEGLLSQLDAVL
jgi:hypothetical protein